MPEALEILGRLRSEMGGRSGTPAAPFGLGDPCLPASGALGRKDEQLVAGLRKGLLALVAPRLGRGKAAPVGLKDALDGAEYVVRGDFCSGRANRLVERLPSFVFLVVLPVLGRPQAIEAAARAERMSSP